MTTIQRGTALLGLALVKEREAQSAEGGRLEGDPGPQGQ